MAKIIFFHALILSVAFILFFASKKLFTSKTAVFIIRVLTALSLGLIITFYWLVKHL